MKSSYKNVAAHKGAITREIKKLETAIANRTAHIANCAERATNGKNAITRNLAEGFVRDHTIANVEDNAEIDRLSALYVSLSGKAVVESVSAAEEISTPDLDRELELGEWIPETSIYEPVPVHDKYTPDPKPSLFTRIRNALIVTTGLGSATAMVVTSYLQIGSF